jgi:hypothetical protein
MPSSHDRERGREDRERKQARRPPGHDRCGRRGCVRAHLPERRLDLPQASRERVTLVVQVGVHRCRLAEDFSRLRSLIPHACEQMLASNLQNVNPPGGRRGGDPQRPAHRTRRNGSLGSPSRSCLRASPSRPVPADRHRLRSRSESHRRSRRLLLHTARHMSSPTRRLGARSSPSDGGLDELTSRVPPGFRIRPGLIRSGLDGLSHPSVPHAGLGQDQLGRRGVVAELPAKRSDVGP